MTIREAKKRLDELETEIFKYPHYRCAPTVLLSEATKLRSQLRRDLSPGSECYPKKEIV